MPDINMMPTYQQQLEANGFVAMNHVAPQFFPVQSGLLFDQDGKSIPGYQRIFRGDTGDTLAIPTEKYTLVPYEHHFEVFEEAIRRSSLDTSDMRVGTDMSDNGARIFRQYLFPNMTTQVVNKHGQANDLALRIVMFDSYNGSSAFVGKAGFFNFVCANEAVFGKSLLDVRFRHVGDMAGKVEEAAEALVDVADTFAIQARRMKKWPQIFLTNEDAGALLNKLPQGNKRLTNDLLADFARSDGNSLWDLSQTLTSWGTHGIPAKTKTDRQKRISDLIEGKDWQYLEV